MSLSSQSVSLDEETMSTSDYAFLIKLVYEHSRINLGTDKQSLVTARLNKRLRALDLPNYAAYCRHLKGPGANAEIPQLIDLISTNHTHFFREPRHFDYLTNVFLPKWQQQNKGRPFRLWSAASSSGEEPFTLAIVLAEFFGLDAPWQIEGTDISNRIVEQASQAIYSDDKLEPIPAELMRRHFQKGIGKFDGHSRVREALRARVNFRQLNLLQPRYPFAEPFDVIFCRNVMIYFDRQTQQQLVAQLASQLRSGGNLIVGHSESLNAIPHTLKQLQPTIYQKP
jgi:chemotaxis protein methyltransferase CheR